jgi:amino acid transporter
MKGNPLQIDFTTKSFWPDLSSVNNLSFLTAVVFGLVGMELSAVHADEVHNPGKTYPRAMWYSSIIILLSLILGSLAIAIVVPQHQLSVVTGMVQAFMIFFNAYHLTWMEPIIALLIIIGSIGGVAAWIIGPTKGLLVATRDGSAPPFLAHVNKKEVPTTILFLQAIIVTLLCSVFLLMPTVSASYWVLTAMTAQLAMLVYIIMFAAAVYLRYAQPNKARAYKIPGNSFGIWTVAIVGILACIFTIIVGFFPPSQIKVGKILTYELVLIIGILVLSIPPFIIYALRKPHWQNQAIKLKSHDYI